MKRYGWNSEVAGDARGGERRHARAFERTLRLKPLALLISMAFGLALGSAVSAQDIEWVRQFGGVGGSLGGDASNAVDADGNAYVAGATAGTLPGQTSAGDYDAFVRKYDSNGNAVWTRQFGTARWDYATGIALDSTGAYVAGRTTGTFPGQTAGYDDAFVRKYDSNGTELWTRQFGTATYDGAYAISPSDSTGVYVAGMTWGTFLGQVSAGSCDAFVRKYDSNGNERWTRQFGLASYDYASAISSDSTGVYVAGMTGGTFPGQTSAGGYDGFVRKYDSNGNELWTRQFGTTSSDYANGITSDSTGVYVAGETYGEVIPGTYDAFVRKYDSAGNELWTRQFGTERRDWASAITSDSTGVYVAGMTGGALPGQVSAGSEDAFVRKYDRDGNEVWTCQFGTARWDYANGISSDSTGLYVAGDTGGTFPGQTSAGGYDSFLAKISVNQAPTANAGPDQTIHVGNLATLDGSGSSDPEQNYPLAYSWQIISKPQGSEAELFDSTLVNPSFIPDVSGDYTVELVVTDSLGLESMPDLVVISTYNTAPVAEAGDDQAVIEIGSLVQLNGGQSYDVDGDDITYFWTITQKPSGSTAVLSNLNAVDPNFIVDVHGDYIVTLVVTDILGAASQPDSMTVSFSNVKPVAVPGGNQAIVEGDTVCLDGSGSYDGNGDELIYNWSIVSKPSGSNAELSNSNTVAPCFVADKPGSYVISLIVNDGFVDSDAANVSVMAITNEDAASMELISAMNTINEFAPESFNNRNLGNALTNKINAALELIDQGYYIDAIDKLRNDILQKTNGCAETGAPDKNDWIVTCSEQGQVYPLILEAIQYLEEAIP